MAEFLSILDDSFVFRIRQLPIDCHLLFSFARFRNALEEIVALRVKAGFGQLEIFGNTLGRFPEWLVFWRLGIKLFICTRSLNHHSQRLICVSQQSLRVSRLPRGFFLSSLRHRSER